MKATRHEMHESMLGSKHLKQEEEHKRRGAQEHVGHEARAAREHAR